MVNLHAVGSTETGFGGCDDNFTLGHIKGFGLLWNIQDI